MKGIISADKTVVRSLCDLRCRKTVDEVLSLISEIFGAVWGRGRTQLNARTRGKNDSLSNGQGYRWNVQHGGIALPLVHAFHRMYEVAVPL